MADNEHAAPSLGQAEVLSVKHSVDPPIPELPQRPKEVTKVPSAVRRQDAGHVLPYQPLGPKSVSQAKIDEHEIAAGIGKSAPEPCDTKGLAGCFADENIEGCIGP